MPTPEETDLTVRAGAIPPGRRRTVEETEEVFRRLGLDGPFWQLR